MLTQEQVIEAEDAYRAAFYEIPGWMLRLSDEEFVKLANDAVEKGNPLPEQLESEQAEEEKANAAIREYQKRFGGVPWAFQGMDCAKLVDLVEKSIRTGKEFVPEYDKGVLY